MTATGAQVSEAGSCPRVCSWRADRGDHGRLRVAQRAPAGALGAAGLVCSPRCAPELAGPALAAAPSPCARSTPSRVAHPPSAQIAGWYRRSPDHAPAPPGVRELVQAPGEGFGPGDHATTAMCLEAIDALPAGAAVDAGCGSGLLAQAWVALGRGR